ncbi:uncharacterized protein ARMOST_18550 [Armillaria ostoyae]|uniref:Uncharacterized protein n=1 Tax=Armillaria ostoyae TaxID=47428 RepID=A0A284S232_ARMOS|nr:uncharacterized protein ARMOST_18550 [Armillaria ostoyae]
MLYKELDVVAPNIISEGAYLRVPLEPLPLPDEEDAGLPTFGCSSCRFLNNPGVHSPYKWYSVTRGWAISVVQGSANQLALVLGVSGFQASKGTTHKEAVTIFNDALACQQVTVVPKKVTF